MPETNPIEQVAREGMNRIREIAAQIDLPIFAAHAPAAPTGSSRLPRPARRCGKTLRDCLATRYKAMKAHRC
jgi:hypothetical protein